MLGAIMEQYRALSETQGMISRTMGEIAAAARPGVAGQRESFPRAPAPHAPRPEVVPATPVRPTVP
jgi:hypothetical protein